MTETETPVAAADTGPQSSQVLSITLKQFMEGVNSVFYGVTQILQSISPSVAREIVENALVKENDENAEKAGAADGGGRPADDHVPDHGGGDDQSEVTNDGAETEKPRKKKESAKKSEVSEGPTEPEVSEKPADTAAESSLSVSVDDITKIIVRKIKQDKGNNTKIGTLLKSYGVEKVSDLPVEKFEAFLTDISQI